MNANIFEAFLNGDPLGFNLIYFTYQYPLKEFARKLLGRDDLAEDAMAEALGLLWERRGSFESAIHIQRFLYLVVLNYCRTERRILRRWFSGLPARWDEIDPDASELAALNELNAHNQWILEKMRDQLAQLPEQRAQDFREYYFHSKSFKAIAGDRRVALDTVRMNVQLAMKEIRKYLETNRYPGYVKKS